MKNIILIGFMGTGKSTIGKILASRKNFTFIEMDDLIVKKAEKSIPEIFDEHGENTFREYEMAVCKDLMNRKKCIISAGGGVVLNQLNINYLKTNGIVVLLEATVKDIYNRITLDGKEKRPLLNKPNPKNEIKSLLSYRRPFYHAAADLKISTRGKIPEQIAEEILNKLDSPKQHNNNDLGGLFNEISDILISDSDDESKRINLPENSFQEVKELYETCLQYDALDPLHLLETIVGNNANINTRKTANMIVSGILITILRNYINKKGAIEYKDKKIITEIPNSKIALTLHRAMVIPYGCTSYLGISSLSMGVGIAISVATNATPKTPDLTHLVNEGTYYALQDIIKKNMFAETSLRRICESVLISAIKFMEEKLKMVFIS